MPYYRNQKGQFTKKENYIELLIQGAIGYGTKTTNDPRSKKQFQIQEKINIGGGPRGGIKGQGQYKAETIILENGKEIYLVYQTEHQRQEIIDRILANQISPKDNQREDGQRINTRDRAQLKQGRYAAGKEITGLRDTKGKFRSSIQTKDFKDLAAFTKAEYQQTLKR